MIWWIYDEIQESLRLYLQKMELEISGYVSDGENMGHAVTSSALTSGGSFSQAADSCKRSISDWVRSAQALLQTPQKPPDRQSKTPEDSGKKKRKFQRFDRFRFQLQVQFFFFCGANSVVFETLKITNQYIFHWYFLTEGGKAPCFGPGVRCYNGNVSMAKIMSKRTPGITRGR